MKFTAEQLAAHVETLDRETLIAIVLDVVGCLYATTETNVYDTERETDSAAEYIPDAMAEAIPPACDNHGNALPCEDCESNNEGNS